jgi:hypothetical protein
LAESLWQDADKALLTQYADDLEREAAALMVNQTLSLPPVAAEQVQQQQSAKLSTEPQVPKDNN